MVIYYFHDREVGLPDGLGWVHGMVHRWCIWYGTSLVYMVWYIVGVYGMVHSWVIWYGTLFGF